MPVVETDNFGRVEYEAGTEMVFPRGLPGFENARAFLALHQPGTDPLIFLQSVEDGRLCFITVPVQCVNPGYRLEADPEDLELVGLPREGVKPGGDVLCLAVLSIREDGPTANLLAPVIVNSRTRLCVQAIAPHSEYSHQHRLAAEEALACS